MELNSSYLWNSIFLMVIKFAKAKNVTTLWWTLFHKYWCSLQIVPVLLSNQKFHNCEQEYHNYDLFKNRFHKNEPFIFLLEIAYRKKFHKYELSSILDHIIDDSSHEFS